MHVRPVLRPTRATAGFAALDADTGIRTNGALRGPVLDPRVSVVAAAVVEPDVRKHVLALFDPAFDPNALVLLEDDPPSLAGAAGESAPPPRRSPKRQTLSTSKRLRAAGISSCATPTIQTGVSKSTERPPRSFAPTRCFCAVRLAPGRHTVRFSYLPRPLVVGLVLSLLTALALVAASPPPLDGLTPAATQASLSAISIGPSNPARPTHLYGRRACFTHERGFVSDALRLRVTLEKLS